MTLPLLHQVAAAIEPLGPSLVLVGGTAHVRFCVASPSHSPLSVTMNRYLQETFAITLPRMAEAASDAIYGQSRALLLANQAATTPTGGGTEYSTHVGTVTTYFRYALITAYDLSKFRANGKQVQLWRTTVTSSGASGDLRRFLPILVSVAVPYLGSNMGQQLEVHLYESDDTGSTIKN